MISICQATEQGENHTSLPGVEEERSETEFCPRGEPGSSYTASNNHQGLPLEQGSVDKYVNVRNVRNMLMFINFP